MSPCYSNSGIFVNRQSCRNDNSCGDKRERLITEHLNHGQIRSVYDVTILEHPDTSYNLGEPGQCGGRVKYIYNISSGSVTVNTNGLLSYLNTTPNSCLGPPGSVLTLIPVNKRWAVSSNNGFTFS